MAENEKKEGRVAKFFRDLKSERKKITWPSKEDTLKKTGVVIVELVIAAAVVVFSTWASASSCFFSAVCFKVR